MKHSKYNHIIQYESNYIFFNGITKKFMLVPLELKRIVESSISHPEEVNKYFEFSKKLIEAGFIIEDNVDELNLIYQKYTDSYNKKEHILTILPTYDCNFSCWYCIQNHRTESMNTDIVERIKLHIANYLTKNDIKRFLIKWFGGEPLLYYNIVNQISNYALEFCKKNNIIYENHMTTNGYLITEQMAKEMETLQFRSYQITIDGDKENHNKIRNENSKPSFSQILKNIITILDAQPHTNITLRFNYTDTELNISPDKIISDINKIIPSEYRKRIYLLPRKVWQVDKNLINVELKNKLYTIFRNNGYNIEGNCDVCMNFIPCPNEQRHHYTIFHNGAIGKCSNIDPNKCIGYLDENGNICNSPESTINLFSDSKNICNKCKFLPLCMGPCVKRRESTDKKGCVLQMTDSPFEESIIRYCESTINNKSI